jgi:hypothetical protein
LARQTKSIYMPVRTRQITCRGGARLAEEDGVTYLLVGEKLSHDFLVRRGGVNGGRVSVGGG